MPFDTSPIRRAVSRLGPVSKKNTRELMTSAARGFIRTVVEITPPASKGVSGSGAKKVGEAAIAGDVRKIFVPASDSTIAEFRAINGEEQVSPFAHKGAKPLGNVTVRILAFAQMAAWHAARRRKDGRVMNIHRDATTGLRKRDLPGLDQGIVATRDFLRFIKVLQSNVGWLAAGWNPAAKLLGVSLPAWIRRHTGAAGNAVEVDAAGKFRLTLSNEVGFVGNVRGYEHRIDRAIGYEANKLNRQADFLLRKSLRRAGF